MKLNADDPRLTAYALGELGDEEHAAIAAALAENPEARAAVEETFAAIKRLDEALSRGPAPELTAAQREAIMDQSNRPQSTTDEAPPPRAIRWTVRRLATVAAMFVLAIGAVRVYTNLDLILPGAYYWIASVRESSSQANISRDRWGSENYDTPLGLDGPPTLGQVARAVILGDRPDRFEMDKAGEVGESPALAIAPAQPTADRSAAQSAAEPPSDLLRRRQAAVPPVPGMPQPPAAEPGYNSEQPAPAGAAGNWLGYRAPQAPRPDYESPPLAWRYGYPAPDVPAERYPGTEDYDYVQDNPFLTAGQNPLSTFAVDVDTASYANIRRFITQQGQLPPPSAVRIEEMVNYFQYDYPPPTGGQPFAVNVEVADCPWQPEHRLVRIGLKGAAGAVEERPDSNLVFLVDVSGSMEPANKLPLLKESMKFLVDQLGRRDRVAIVAYESSSRLVLPSTAGDDKWTIVKSLDQLYPGGSTNGAAGIQQAYDLARANFIAGGVNRVILATDGDFNVGITNRGDLVRLIEDEARSGVYLTVLGFGMGNLKDATLESLADRGNGNYAYIDTLNEGHKVLVQQISGTLTTIAKDVKIQVEFNPAQVGAYRLIGYENRVMAAQDFYDDAKDAGELGAGHTVTALYEVIPAGVAPQPLGPGDLKYQQPGPPPPGSGAPLSEAVLSGEMLTVKLRYKEPNGFTGRQLDVPVVDQGRSLAAASADFKFAAAVASFGMILRQSPYRGNATLDGTLALAEAGAKGADPDGYRAEFSRLVDAARYLR